MAHPRKPESDIGRVQKYRRARQISDPAWYKQEQKKRKEYHIIHQARDSKQKSDKQKHQKESLYVVMGGKCESCKEDYNSNLSPTNLQFAHKRKTATKKNRNAAFRQAMSAYKDGGLKSLKKQFSLLCYSCHKIFDTERRNPKKYPKIIAYIEKIKVENSSSELES